ncbi:MAG: hypothetical protein A2939_00500 [Parcubacteria group bacterium RIFCSPLOWO2_01_FULL_48_18]|nr:MAG: hypothetical protein A3J67_05625 [Parcubacteria group bacterium RIFCSPHIGHO2_02_FULL_48_10b]OHB21962.1 MAG: hypothetical protein A2939_00500 [Parcubacteria group bacterium RIFCSPLOWO2_01_FULL_48_18]
MKEAAKLFKVLSNEKRLGILKLLTKHNELTVSDIADRVNLSIKATSKHTIMLYNAKILDRRQGKGTAYYSLNKPLNKFAHLALVAMKELA